jgi:type I restriction enzyme S subunit
MSFPDVALGDVITLQRGFDITKEQQVEGSVPIVSSSGIASFHNESKVRAPGVVIGRKGSLGTVHFLGEDFWPHDTTLWVKDFKGNDPRFIGYFLKTLRLEVFDTGSSNPTLNRNHVHKIKVQCPPPETQRKIAAILSAYDDLIANNQRRIALLEGMAEEIYREWFVRMRFPGAANVEVEKGVPRGWSLVPTIEAFKYHGGATPAKDVPRYWNQGSVHWYTPTDITGAEGMFIEASSERCTEEGLESCSATLFPAYTVMMTSRATIGAIGINLEPACTNQGFIACVPNEQYPLTFLYHWLKLAKPHFELLSGGSTFPELTKGTFRRIKVLTPPSSVMQSFDATVKPLFAQIETLIRANRRLKETRDALLPRLISGKLKVDHLDIRLPPSMRAEAEAVA